MNKILAALRFLFRKRLKLSSDVINTRVKGLQYQLSNEQAANYNEVVSNVSSGEATTDIHPLFFTKISWHLIENLNDYLEDPIDGEILNTIVHQSEHITLLKEVDSTAELTVKSNVWSIAPHKKGTKMVVRFEYYSKNELVAIEYSGGLLFGVKCIGEAQSRGDIPRTQKIESPSLWEELIDIDKSLPYDYAEKADIDAPIHTNPTFAKSIGLPDIIVQGTCTFAKSVNVILDKELNNSIGKIKSVSAKFTGMVVPPDRIRVRVLKKEKGVLYFDVINKKNSSVIKGGQITLK